MSKLIYWDGKPGSVAGLEPDEYLVWDCDRNQSIPGWYWLNGKSLDDPNGPFETEQAAREFRP